MKCFRVWSIQIWNLARDLLFVSELRRVLLSIGWNRSLPWRLCRCVYLICDEGSRKAMSWIRFSSSPLRIAPYLHSSQLSGSVKVSSLSQGMCFGFLYDASWFRSSSSALCLWPCVFRKISADIVSCSNARQCVRTVTCHSGSFLTVCVTCPAILAGYFRPRLLAS